MAFLLANLEASGTSPMILRIDNYLGKPFYGRPRSKDINDAIWHYAAVTVIEKQLDESEGVSEVIKWLSENKEKLLRLPGDKVLEFQCGLMPDEGSRFLTIPINGLQILAELECKLSHQFMKAF